MVKWTPAEKAVDDLCEAMDPHSSQAAHQRAAAKHRARKAADPSGALTPKSKPRAKALSKPVAKAGTKRKATAVSEDGSPKKPAPQSSVPAPVSGHTPDDVAASKPPIDDETLEDELAALIEVTHPAAVLLDMIKECARGVQLDFDLLLHFTSR